MDRKKTVFTVQIRGRWWAPFLLLAIVIAAVYGKSARYPFVYFDDNKLIVDSIAYLTTPHTLIDAFKNDVFRSHNSDAYYRPLLTLSLMADAAAGGLSSSTYHISNIFIHLLAVWLAFMLLKELGYEKAASLLGALVYAVHPALTQATAWIPGRNDSLLAVFVFMSIIFLLKDAREPRVSTKLAQITAFAAALFTKETALILWALFPAALWVTRTPLKKKASPIFIGSWAVVTAAWFLLRAAAFAHPAMNSLSAMALSLWRNLPALAQMIGKIIIPVNLSVLPVMRDTTFVYGIISCALIGALFVATRDKDYRRIAFGAAWFLLFLLPSFIRPNPSVQADFIEHRLYVPFFGGLIVMLELLPVKMLRRRPRSLVYAGSVLIVAFSAMTFSYLDVFGHRLDFWQNAAEHSPHHPLARRNFGAVLFMEGMPERAEKEYLAALRLNQREPMANNNLGLIYMQRGDYARAESSFKKELAVNPGYDDAYYNYGLLESRMNDGEAAAEMWRTTIALNPDYGAAYDSLVRYYLSIGDIASAFRYYDDMEKRRVPIDPELIRIIEQQRALNGGAAVKNGG